MLAYAPERRTRGASTRSTQTLTFVVVGHILLVGVALTTKMTIDRLAPPPPIDVTFVPNPPPPPEPQPKVEPQKPTTESKIDNVPPIIPTRPTDTGLKTDPGPTIPSGPISGTSPDPGPTTVIEPAKPTPVRVAARFNTPDSALRPPYPLSKLRAEEETTLRLRLTIDANGRVTAVDPVAAADPTFLEAARRHIMRSWRYKPATVDGVATGSSTIVSLSFRLRDA